MQTDHILFKSLRVGVQTLAFIAVLTWFATTVPAVEQGKLSITAEGTTATRALFNMHPDKKIRNEDNLAMQMIHPDYWHYSLVTDDFEKSMHVIKAFRMHTHYYVNARTKHIDATLKKAAADGIQQVVNLGAGYDSRAYRFRKSMPDVKFFEIELPAMVKEKQGRLKKIFGEVPDYVTFVPIDFSIQTIPGELQKAGFDPNLRTLFIWEGVTYYIPEEAVDSTLKFVASTAPGNVLVFDYMPLGVIKENFTKYADMRGLSFWVKYKGEPWIFGVPEGESKQYIEARGLKVLSDMGPKDLEAHYLTRTDGKLEGPCPSGFRIMNAAVPAK